MKSHIEEFLENPENKRLFNQEKLILDLEYKLSKKLKEKQLRFKNLAKQLNIKKKKLR